MRKKRPTTASNGLAVVNCSIGLSSKLTHVNPLRIALARRRQHARVDVDSDDGPLRADQLGREEAHIAHPAAEIQHAHSRGDARFPEDALRRRAQNTRLLGEPLALRLRPTQDVLRGRGIGLHWCSPRESLMTLDRDAPRVESRDCTRPEGLRLIPTCARFSGSSARETTDRNPSPPPIDCQTSHVVSPTASRSCSTTAGAAGPDRAW